MMMGYAHSFTIPVSPIVSVLPSVIQERQTVRDFNIRNEKHQKQFLCIFQQKKRQRSNNVD